MKPGEGEGEGAHHAHPSPVPWEPGTRTGPPAHTPVQAVLITHQN